MSRVLIVSGDVVDYFMGGVGVRYWCLANALAEHCEVILAVPNQTELKSEKVELVSFDLQKDNILHLTSGVDVIVTHGFVLHFHPYLRELNIPIAVDLYVPYLLESLVWHDRDNWSEWIPAYEEYLRVQLDLLRIGDFFFCASERQRDYWLGWLHAQKRINPHTYHEDPTLRKLIDVVPFGLPESDIQHTKAVLKGVHPKISLDDRLVLWSGGLWDWLDPVTLIHAIHLLVPKYPDLKLYFMGTVHPNSDVNTMTMPAKAMDLCQELGLLDENIFFGDWVSYFERENYLAEADLAVIAHPDHIETHFSFRTRVLDAIWARIPLIITDGDDFAGEVARQKIGVVVGQGNPKTMAAAIEEALYKQKLNISWENFENLRKSLQWKNVIAPLLNFCLHPGKMVDKGKYLTELERITRDKDNFFVGELQKRDTELERNIQQKETEYRDLVAEKDSQIEQIVQEKEKQLEEALSVKDEEIRLITESNERQVDEIIRHKDSEIKKTSEVLLQQQNLLPLVTVIVVNYNGKHYLRDCLEALKLQTYPRHRWEAIISDNASSDGSVELMKEEYPWVQVLSNRENLGFASGNNVAIERARGEYIVLLNNDTAVDPTWLEGLVRTASTHPDAGLVSGHLQLFYEQLEIKIECDTFMPENDRRPLGVQVFDVQHNLHKGVVQYLEGFYGWEKIAAETQIRWTKGNARLGIPVPRTPGDWTISLWLAAHRPVPEPVAVKIHIQGQLQVELTLSGSQPERYDITLPESVKDFAVPLVQNVGSVVFYNGSGRDKGTYVRDFEVFYEVDQGQYSQVEEIFAGCGASLLLRRSMLEDVGLLDDDFFMYYEDTDLSWRAKLKGWKVIYAPDAVVKHIHCGSSGEWSPFFLFHVERNRLAMVFKNGTWKQVFQTWVSFIYHLAKDCFVRVISIGKGYPSPHLKLRIKVLVGLFIWIPALIKKRWVIQRNRKFHPLELEKWFLRE